MIGVLALISMWILPVALNWSSDRGTRERRTIGGSGYGWALARMGEFDAAGGRVQEVAEASAMTRRTFRLTICGPFLLAAVLVAAQMAIGFPHWIVATVIAGFVFLNATLTWVVSERFGVTNAEGSSSAAQRLAVTLASAAKSAFVWLGVQTAYAGVSTVGEGRWLEGIGLDIAAYLLVTYCYLPVAWTERLTRAGSREASAEFAVHTTSETLLFLRSFADDDFRLFTPVAAFGPRYRFVPGRRRFEEFLAAALTGSGRLVGIGRPDERVPSLGAARSYWSDDDWKSAVQATAGRSKAVIVMAGLTPSLAWEMQQLSELRVTTKVLILFPPDRLDATAQRHQLITDALNVHEERLLPDDLLPTLTAMAFDAEGQPIYYLSAGRDWSAYIATVVFYLGTLTDRFRHESGGKMASTVALTDDPFNLAAYLMGERGRRPEARAIVAKAVAEDDSPMTAVGAAWAELEIEADVAAARRILTAALARHPDDELLVRAAGVLGEVGAGRAKARALLWTRYPAEFRTRPEVLIDGTAKLGLRARPGFAKLTMAAKDGWSGWSASEAQEAANTVRALAADNPTATAQADLWAADALLHMGQLQEARSLYQQCSLLTAAPRTEINKGLPFIDPRDVVDQALLGLRKVATAVDEKGEEALVAGERLRMFRVDHNLREKAATAADWLMRSCAERKSYDQAIDWGLRARSEFEQLGQKLEAARCAVRLAEACNNIQDWEQAAQWSGSALGDAKLIDDDDLVTWAQFESARSSQGRGDDAVAVAGFSSVFDAELPSNRWRARASMIRIGEVDELAVVPISRAAVSSDLAFFGPRAASLLAAAARATTNVVEAASIRREVLGVGSRCLVNPEISEFDSRRVWQALADVISAAPDDERPDLVADALRLTADASLAGLLFAAKGLLLLGNARQYDTLVDLAGPICDRAEAALTPQSEPADLINVGWAVWELRRGYRFSNRPEEALVTSVRMVAIARRAGALDQRSRNFLAVSLVKLGHDLNNATRMSEATKAYTEAVVLLEGLTDDGIDVWERLCEALTSRGETQRDSGNADAAALDFDQVQGLINSHASAPWADDAQSMLNEVMRIAT